MPSTVRAWLLLSLLSAAAPVAAQTLPPWRDIATTTDRGRIREWRTAWTKGLAQARASGHGAEIDKEGKLLDPDAAVAWQDPPAGEYACRVIKIGSQSEGMLDYVTYSAFRCRIREEGGMTSFAKLTGSQRPIGLLMPTGQDRMVFLGTLQLGDEQRSLEYGRDQDRDMAGVMERIGDQRWRLFFPFPHFESTIDVLEIVPKGVSS